MKKAVALVGAACMLYAGQAGAQQKVWVAGMVADATDHKAIPGATLELRVGKQTYYAVSNDSGYFAQKVPAGTMLFLQAAGTGYAPASRQAPLAGKDSLHLDTLFLARRSTALAEVTVSARRTLTVAPDRIVYLVKSDTTNKGLSGYEIIQKAPFIDIASDQKMYVSGQANFRILINGRLSGVANQDPVAYLRNLPASALDKIEIITDPPVRYRQEGIDKLVNIITDKSLAPGMYGAVNATADSRGGIDGGYLFMYHSKKLSLSTNLSAGNTRGVWSDYVYESSFANGSADQKGRLKNQSTSLTPSLEATYEVDSLRLVNVSVFGSFNSLHSQSQTRNAYWKANNNYWYDRTTNSDRENSFYYAGVDYEQFLKGTRRQALVSFSSKLLHQENNYETGLVQRDSLMQQDFRNSSLGSSNEWTNQVNFSKTSQAGAWELGFKNIYRMFASGIHANDQYTFLQQINTPYVDWKLDVSKQQFVKVGGLVEFTKLTYREEQGPGSWSKNLINLSPRAGFYGSLPRNRSYSLQYSLATRRPGIRHLNPVVTLLSPDVVQYGNPELRQELHHSFVVSYTTSLLGKLLALSFYNRFSGTHITEVRAPLLDSVMAITYRNNGRYLMAGNTLYYAIVLQKKLTLRFNTDIAYQRYSSEGQSRQGLYYKLFITTAYKLPRNYSVSLQGFLYSRSLSFQGYASGYPDVFCTVSKKWPKAKLNTSLVVYQPFLGSFTQEQRYSGSTFYQYAATSFPTRYAGVRLNYDFGNFSKAFAGRKKQKGITNDDLKE